MKNIQLTVVITFALLTIVVFQSPAQNRDEVTSGARAAYGNLLDPVNNNKMKRKSGKIKKKYKVRKNAKQAKAIQDKSPANHRKRNGWAG